MDVEFEELKRAYEAATQSGIIFQRSFNQAASNMPSREHLAAFVGSTRPHWMNALADETLQILAAFATHCLNVIPGDVSEVNGSVGYLFAITYGQNLSFSSFC